MSLNPVPSDTSARSNKRPFDQLSVTIPDNSKKYKDSMIDTPIYIAKDQGYLRSTKNERSPISLISTTETRVQENTSQVFQESSRSSSSSSELTSPVPKRMSNLQKYTMGKFSSNEPIPRPELEQRICSAFIKMAETSRNPQYAALSLLLVSDNPSKANLLMNLGNSNFRRGDEDSIERAIGFYQQGIVLNDIPNNQKALFCLNLAKVYLSRKQLGDADRAIEAADRGIALAPDELKVLGNLYIIKGEALLFKDRHSHDL